MNTRATGADLLLAEGQVVEIFEKAHELRAKILLKSGTVLDVTVGRGADVHLGDEVEVEGAVTLRSIRAKVDSAEPQRVRTDGERVGTVHRTQGGHHE